MRSVLLPRLPAALIVDSRSAATALVAMRKVISKLAATAMPFDYCNHHHMLVRPGSHIISRFKAENGQHRPTSASAKYP